MIAAMMFLFGKPGRCTPGLAALVLLGLFACPPAGAEQSWFSSLPFGYAPRTQAASPALRHRPMMPPGMATAPEPLQVDPVPPMGRLSRTELQGPENLPARWARAAQTLAGTYSLDPAYLARVVAAVLDASANAGLDPTLVMAVAAVESRFNAYVKSPAGALGIMQVHFPVHGKRFGGDRIAAFDLEKNLEVGCGILRLYLKQSGSALGALRRYVGAANLAEDGGYGMKVLRLRRAVQAALCGSSRPLSAVDQIEVEDVSASELMSYKTRVYCGR